MDPYKTTFETWNKVAGVYQEKFMDLAIYNETYDQFLKLIPYGNACILDIGCGPGNSTRYILSKRPDVAIKGIDVAPNMIELARINNPSATFEVMDCRFVDAVNEKYNAILCGFCIPYLSMSDCVKLIRDTTTLLFSGGYFYLSFIEGDYTTSGFKIGSTGDQAFVYFYQKIEIEKLLIENNFEIISCSEVEYLKLDQSKEINVIFIAKTN